FSTSEVFLFSEEGGGPWDRTRSASEWGPGASPSGYPEASVLPGSKVTKLGDFCGALDMMEPVALMISEEEARACISSGFLCGRSSSRAYNGSSSEILMGDFSGNVVSLPVSAIYDEHQKAKTWKRRPFYTPPPRLARVSSSVNGLSSTSSTGAEAVPNNDPLVDTHWRSIGEVFFLRSQVQDMLARRDLLVQQVKASAR
ncbi:hypothetical protein HID58_074720, partial [Brassica napus]